jgi:hypothetical protein
MRHIKSILRAAMGGLVLAAVLAVAGCGDGGGRHMSFGGRDHYPTVSRGGHDGGGFGSHGGGWSGGSRGGWSGGHGGGSWARR